MVRVELAGSGKGGFGVALSAESAQGDTPLSVSLGVVRIDFDGGLKLSERVGDTVQLQQSLAMLAPNVCIAWLKRNRSGV